MPPVGQAEFAAGLGGSRPELGGTAPPSFAPASPSFVATHDFFKDNTNI